MNEVRLPDKQKQPLRSEPQSKGEHPKASSSYYPTVYILHTRCFHHVRAAA
uniref:Uncharacterized protein n=1 Tax=Picea glauca TaxID=3330 RepID=A0A101M2G5_PICGL|nr:hypothetical protein ABT39_MTgene2919 [Picea glauca]